MHYHWGLGVGHLHAHQPTSTSNCIPDEAETQDGQFQGVELGESTHAPNPYPDDATDIESDNPELGLDDREADIWQDSETEGSKDGSDIDDEHNSEGTEEDFVGM
jgi:hypothetical protein